MFHPQREGDADGIGGTVPPRRDCPPEGHTISPGLKHSRPLTLGPTAHPGTANAGASPPAPAHGRRWHRAPPQRTPPSGAVRGYGALPGPGAGDRGVWGHGRAERRHVGRIRGCGRSRSQLRDMLKSAASPSLRRPSRSSGQQQDEPSGMWGGQGGPNQPGTGLPHCPTPRCSPFVFAKPCRGAERCGEDPTPRGTDPRAGMTAAKASGEIREGRVR